MAFRNRMKIEIAALLVFTLAITVIGAVADNRSLQSDAKSRGVTAGASELIGTEMVESNVTAGVSSVLSDVNTIGIRDTDLSTSADWQDAGFCGYTNLGIAVVEEGNLNVRKGPSTSDEIVGKMTNHAACEILSTDGEWTEISSGNVTGFVNNAFLITGDEALDLAKQIVQTVATVHTDTLRVREEPNTESAILSLVGDGEDLVVTEELGDWVKVEVDDHEGYVAAEFVDVSLKLPAAMTLTELHFGQGVSDGRVALCQFALQYVGNPYVWGGTSLTRGADCSGFVLSVFANYGYSLPHSSRAQANCGTRIKSSELQPGDLIFYGSGKSISHVAIYIGGGQIVHASNKRDGIKISNAFYRTPICYTRIIND